LGHFSGSIDDVASQAAEGWTNVAPYASVSASSHYVHDDPEYQPFTPDHAIDRRGWVPALEGSSVGEFQDQETGWLSEEGRSSGEWLELSWPANVTVQSIRLVGAPPTGGDWEGFGQPPEFGDYYIESGELQLSLDGAPAGAAISVGRVEPLVAGGTQVILDTPVTADRVRFTIAATSGRWWWSQVAALNEIEVIGKSAEPFPAFTSWSFFLPVLQR
jgi:hypothetical protein